MNPNMPVQWTTLIMSDRCNGGFVYIISHYQRLRDNCSMSAPWDGNSPEPGRCAAAADRASPLVRPRAPHLPPPTRAIAANSFISPNKLYQTKRVCPAPCICSPSCSRCSWPPRLALTRSPAVASRERENKRPCNAARPFHSLWASQSASRRRPTSNDE